MTGFEPVIAGFAGLALDTLKDTVKEESGSSLAKLLQKDVGKAFEQVFFRASGQYIANYQKRHGMLKVSCVRMDEPIALEEIFVAVQLLPRSKPSYYDPSDGLQNSYRSRGKRDTNDPEQKKQDGVAIANQEPYLFVLGQPGAGKSTLLRKIGLEALKRKQGTFQHDCIPVFIALQRFRAQDITLKQLIIKEFETCGFPEPEAFTEAMLKKGKLLLLLDGLDEVASQYQDFVITQTQDFVDLYSNNRFITSCRTAAYKGGFLHFKDVEMSPFEDSQIEQFIRQWFRSPKDQEAKTADQCWELIQRPEYQAAKELAQTPLLLTLLCSVYDKSLNFPKNRSALYGEALDVLMKEWAAEKRIQRDPIYQDLSIELERELLAEIAHESFVENQLFFDKRFITDRIRSFLVSNLNAPKHLDSEKVLEAIEVQQGILVERTRDTYSFSHLTFQEYLIAHYIVDNQQLEWLVSHHLTNKQWREVFLLVVGLMPGRKGADDLLLKMEKQAQVYINTPKLKALLRWASQVTEGSEGKYKSAAKRTVAIYVALALAVALDLALDPGVTVALEFDPAFASDLDRARYLTCALNPDLALAFTLYPNYTFHLAHARTLQELKIFKATGFTDLIANLERMQTRIPDDNQPNEVLRTFAAQIQRLWFEALKLEPTLVRLSADKFTALESYFYANELMVRCKEAAVRVSPQVWEGIEERMLTVRED